MKEKKKFEFPQMTVLGKSDRTAAYGPENSYLVCAKAQKNYW